MITWIDITFVGEMIHISVDGNRTSVCVDRSCIFERDTLQLAFPYHRIFRTTGFPFKYSIFLVNVFIKKIYMYVLHVNNQEVLKYCSMYIRCCATTARWADIPGPFSGNGSVNTFPLLGSRLLIMQQLDYNNGRAVFSTLSVPRCYNQGTRLELSQLCAGVCEERT
jgi:hypothetical protein